MSLDDYKKGKPIKNKGRHKKQAAQILATVVMGMNLVNTVAPLAVLAGAEQKLVAAPQPARREAEPLDYAVLPQLADMVDRAMFARAEAANYDGNASVPSLQYGDDQIITAGQNGIVSTMSGGEQGISSGGKGTVSTMSGGVQNISSGGSGTVDTMKDGVQNILSGGKGTVSTMFSGQQIVLSSGEGTISSMSGGSQNISSGGSGTVDIMNDGKQNISSGGGVRSVL